MESLRLNPRIGWRYISDEIVAFNCVNQQMVIWNRVASQLFEMLSKATSSHAMARYLTSQYSISYPQASQDVQHFLNQVKEFGFLPSHNQIQTPTGKEATEGENVLLTVEMKAIAKLIPFAVTLETTYDCNERCIHCYMEKHLPSLSLQTTKRILEELAQAGCLFLSLTGGEFFTRKDALEIARYADQLHFVIDILSNGSLINKAVAQELAQYSVRRVQISLYGARSETHDYITQVKGSFQKTIRAIEHLINAGIKVEVACPLMNINFPERYQIKELAESMGCIVSPSHLITARNNGSPDTFDLRLDDEQMVAFLQDKNISGLYAGRKPFQDHQFYLNFSDIQTAPPCYAGFNSCAITPSGKVLPCNQLLLEVGDLTINPFQEIWFNSPQLEYIRNLTIRNLTKCSSCELLTECARCPGLALLEGRGILEASPENCRIARINHSLPT